MARRGSLDEAPPLEPEAHIFFASRVPWHETGDALPRSEGYAVRP